MRVYLVRNRQDFGILGLFWDENIESLWWQVDSVADPAGYEYAALLPGNLHFADDEPIPRLLEEETEEESLFGPPFSWAKSSSDLGLADGLDGMRGLKWKRFPYADEKSGGIHKILKSSFSKEPSDDKIVSKLGANR